MANSSNLFLDIIINNYFLFTLIKNAQLSKKQFLFTKNSNNSKHILNFLWNNGYICCYRIIQSKIKVYLKYSNIFPVIKKLKILSNNSRQVFLSVSQLSKLNSNKFFIIFANNSLLSLNECKHRKASGLIIAILN